jgi:hypothetical protein
MSFRELAAQLARTAFDLAGDIPVSCVYYHAEDSPSYDPTTGRVLTGAGAADSLVRFVLSPAESFGRPDGNTVQAGHTGSLAALAIATEFNRVPAEGDLVTAGLNVYRVIALKSDEAGVTYTLLLARIGGGIES